MSLLSSCLGGSSLSLRSLVGGRLLRLKSSLGLLRLNGGRRLGRTSSDPRGERERGSTRCNSRRNSGRDRASGEVRVGKSLVRVVPPVRLELEQVLEEVDRVARRFRNDRVKRLLRVLAERLLDLDLRAVHLDLLQRRVARRADNFHDLDQLVIVVATTEKWVSRDHLREDTSHTPDVDRRAVRS